MKDFQKKAPQQWKAFYRRFFGVKLNHGGLFELWLVAMKQII
jgi:hypothetical protein